MGAKTDPGAGNAGVNDNVAAGRVSAAMVPSRRIPARLSAVARGVAEEVVDLAIREFGR